MDLLSAARKKIVAEYIGAVEQAPKDFSKPYSDVQSIGTAVAGAGFGAWIGSYTGFALIGTAISGAWIVAPLVGLAAYAVSRNLSDD